MKMKRRRVRIGELESGRVGTFWLHVGGECEREVEFAEGRRESFCPSRVECEALGDAYALTFTPSTRLPPSPLWVDVIFS